MFEVKGPEKKAIVAIRAVTPRELANYEKWKQENTKVGVNTDNLEIIRAETLIKKERNFC